MQILYTFPTSKMGIDDTELRATYTTRPFFCGRRPLSFYGIGPSCFFTMYAGIRPLCTSIWYNSSLDDASMILHLTSVFIETLHF